MYNRVSHNEAARLQTRYGVHEDLAFLCYENRAPRCTLRTSAGHQCLRRAAVTSAVNNYCGLYRNHRPQDEPIPDAKQFKGKRLPAGAADFIQLPAGLRHLALPGPPQNQHPGPQDQDDGVRVDLDDVRPVDRENRNTHGTLATVLRVAGWILLEDFIAYVMYKCWCDGDYIGVTVFSLAFIYIGWFTRHAVVTAVPVLRRHLITR